MTKYKLEWSDEDTDTQSTQELLTYLKENDWGEPEVTE